MPVPRSLNIITVERMGYERNYEHREQGGKGFSNNRGTPNERQYRIKYHVLRSKAKKIRRVLRRTQYRN